MGIWDLSVEPFTLGGMLDLVAELKCGIEISTATSADVCLVWDDDHPLPNGISANASTKAITLQIDDWSRSIVVAAMMEFCGIDNLHVANSLTAILEFVQSSDGAYKTWPVLNAETTQINHDYLATLNIQDIFRSQGRIPRIKLSTEPIKRAQALLNDKVTTRRSVIVHAKNDLVGEGVGNADIDVWADFMHRTRHRDITFVVIGNEDVGIIRDLSNVVVTSEFGNDLPRDLALIQLGDVFMGTASGPSQLSILGDRPYAVFKRIDIHPEFMNRELNGQSGFPFAVEGQHFIRIDPTRDDLDEALSRIFSAVPSARPIQ
jgi:hypothetical protein